MPRFILYFPFHEQKRNTFVFHHDDMLICIRVDAEVHRNYNIAFLVWDKDNLSANDLMGCGYLNLASVIPHPMETTDVHTLVGDELVRVRLCCVVFC